MRHPIEYRIVTAAESPELVLEANAKIGHEWPEFMLHDPVAELFERLYRDLPDYQFVMIEEPSGKTVAVGNSVPLSYNEEIEDLPEDGWDWAMKKSFADLDAGATPNMQCAIQIVVFGGNRGKGMSRQAVASMKELGRLSCPRGMVAPVRPNHKPNYPLISIDDYITWKREDGQPFDPWLRVHYSLGAEIIKPCHTAMQISGTVSEWQDWTGIHFLQSGDYVIPGALTPVTFDVRADVGLYIEPNVWMFHPPLR
ncbi:MAG: hypothetical protein P1R58_00700 [bacterium]|nr:hypothetical protein [bacterium]